MGLNIMCERVMLSDRQGLDVRNKIFIAIGKINNHSNRHVQCSVNVFILTKRLHFYPCIDMISYLLSASNRINKAVLRQQIFS